SEVITNHLAWALEFNAMAPASVNSIRRKLLAIAREAYAVKLLADLPRAKRLREPVEEPTSWSLEEIDAILKTCRQLKGINAVSRIPSADWWTCLILLALNTGLRRRSLLALKRADVDLKSSILRVPADAMKNARGKSFRLCEPVMEAIRAIWLPARQKLLPWDIRRECLQRKYTAILVEAGLAAGRRDKFHKLRRTTGTTIAAACGMTAAQEYLGHQSIATTQRYIDPTKLPEADLSGHLERLVSGPKPKLHQPAEAAG
ncbi:MAG: site-specific integrase, partial [Planctomycetes bacterium]|nr:site-specific integrase [Planctomycetota bacterium]